MPAEPYLLLPFLPVRHVLPESLRVTEQGPKGWHGQPFVALDGQNWPLKTAAGLLDLPEQDLRDLVRVVENLRGEALSAGVIRISGFARQGRQPKAYPARVLIALTEGIRDLAERIASGEQEDCPEDHPRAA